MKLSKVKSIFTNVTSSRYEKIEESCKENYELCNGKGKTCLDCLLQELIYENWNREMPKDQTLKIAYDKGIIQDIPSEMEDLSEEDKGRLEFLMVSLCCIELVPYPFILPSKKVHKMKTLIK